VTVLVIVVSLSVLVLALNLVLTQSAGVSPGRATVTAAPTAATGGASQSVTPSVVAQIGHAGLDQVVSNGVVHRGLLGAAFYGR